MWLFLAIAAIPLIEIALFVTVGSWLGLGLTLLIVLGTAALGVVILRGQGQRPVQDLRLALTRGSDPMHALAHGALVVLAAILLILPGFLTDTLGLLLLVPAIRDLVLRLVARRMKAHVIDPRRAGPRHDGVVIDAEFIDLDTGPTPPRPAPPGRPSGWTRH